MLWDLIRDFFVQYIFGGYDSVGDGYFGMVGVSPDDDFMWSNNFMIQVNNQVGDLEYQNYISMGDWLSTTATIICMCLIVFLLICLVRWIFRVVSSAFLLK